jgi:hypothetical protein
LAATASTCSGSATGSASTGSSSATGSADADTVLVAVVVAGDRTGADGFSEGWVTRAKGTGGTWRAAGGRGGGFDVRTAGGGAVDSGRGGSRGGRLEDGFVASTFAGGWEERVDVAKSLSGTRRTASRGTCACTACFVGVSRRPSPKAFAKSILRSASVLVSRPIAATVRTLRARGGGR